MLIKGINIDIYTYWRKVYLPGDSIYCSVQGNLYQGHFNLIRLIRDSTMLEEMRTDNVSCRPWYNR
jgi:hypothetical protein